MKLQVLEVPLTVCKLTNPTAIDYTAHPVFVGVTDDEISLVCPAAHVPAPEFLIAREDGWRAFKVEGPLEFSLVGILSNLSSILAAAGVGIFVVSTYDTDYILVKEANLDKAIASFKAAGHEVMAQQ